MDNVYKEEGCICLLRATGTSLYKLIFIRGKQDAQLNQINHLNQLIQIKWNYPCTTFVDPWPINLIKLYPFNSHNVFSTLTELEELIDIFLTLYARAGGWLELNTFLLEKLATILAGVDDWSTTKQQIAVERSLRFFNDEIKNEIKQMES